MDHLIDYIWTIVLYLLSLLVTNYLSICPYIYFSDSEVTVTLVNTSPSAARELIIQAGAYGEHRVSKVSIGKALALVDAPFFRVEMDPGCGAKLTVLNDRYAEQPTMKFPWDRN